MCKAFTNWHDCYFSIAGENKLIKQARDRVQHTQARNNCLKKRKTCKCKILTNKFRSFPVGPFHCPSQGFRNRRIWDETWRRWGHLCNVYNKPRLIIDKINLLYKSTFIIHHYRSIVCRNSYTLLTAQLLQTCKSTSSSLYAMRFANPLSFLRVTVAWNWFHENETFFFIRASNIKFLRKSRFGFRGQTWKKVERSKEGDKETAYSIRTMQIHLIRDNKLLSSIDTYRHTYLTAIAHIYATLYSPSSYAHFSFSSLTYLIYFVLFYPILHTCGLQTPKD